MKAILKSAVIFIITLIVFILFQGTDCNPTEPGPTPPNDTPDVSPKQISLNSEIIDVILNSNSDTIDVMLNSNSDTINAITKQLK